MGRYDEYQDPKDSRRDAKRALRSKNKQRMKKRAIKVYRDNDPKDAIKLADHIKVCSCMTCGNARKYFGPSLQEIRQDLREKYQ